MTLENSSEDKYVWYFASTSNGTKNKYLAYLGALSGASGAVVRASASLPNGKVKLGHIPTGNAAAYNVFVDNALGQNGRLEGAPLVGKKGV